MPGKIFDETASVDESVSEDWLKTVCPEMRNACADNGMFNAAEPELFLKFLNL